MGYAYGANCGWISLSNAIAHMQTDTMSPSLLALGGLPVALLLINFGTTKVKADANPDGDGQSNSLEYLAGTDPDNAASQLKITAESFTPGDTSANLTWTSFPMRFYCVQKTASFSTPNWLDSGLGIITPSNGSTTTAGFNDTTMPMRFYHVEADRPLMP